MLWIALALIVLLPILALIWRVDDWSRDLTTNEATTSSDATDPLLRPLLYQGTPQELATRVGRAVEQLPHWKVVSEEPQGDGITLYLTRRTALFGFIDDIQVTIRPEGTAVKLTAHSKSRLGKGDLGQNPRNLKQLLTEVKRQIEHPTP